MIAKNSISSVTSASCSLEVDTLPMILPKFEGVNVKNDKATLIEDEKKNIELDFMINGKPEPNVEYFKDDVKFKASEKRVLFTKKDGLYKLEIPDIKSTDGGIYKILAKNTCGEQSYVIDFKIKSAPVFVKNLKNVIECVEDSKLELNSTIATGVFPNPEFQWFKNGDLIDESNCKDTLILNELCSSKLIIEHVELLYDQSKYKLKCFNDFGACETETKLEVISIPKFKKSLTDSNPILNQTFEWPFSIDSNPESKIKFFKNEKEMNFTKETRIKILKEMETKGDRYIYNYKMIFNNMVADDIATYQIEASNKAGEAKSQAQLVVIGAPCFIRKPTDISVTLNKPIKIDCEIAGIPIPNIAWYKDGEPLIENDRIKIENKLKTTFILNIKNCLKEDQGLYTIKLQNESGTAEESFMLTIQGRLILFVF